MTDENKVKEEINGTVTEKKKSTRERKNYRKEGENQASKRGYNKQEDKKTINTQEVAKTRRTKIYLKNQM